MLVTHNLCKALDSKFLQYMDEVYVPLYICNTATLSKFILHKGKVLYYAPLLGCWYSAALKKNIFLLFIVVELTALCEEVFRSRYADINITVLLQLHDISGGKLATNPVCT